MAVEIYTERLFKIPNIATKCKYCVCWLVLQEMSKIPMLPDAPIYVMYMLVFAYLQILFAFFLLLHHLPLCWYFCHLDTVFAASLPPFLLTSATRGALVLIHNPTIFMQMFQIHDFDSVTRTIFKLRFHFNIQLETYPTIFRLDICHKNSATAVFEAEKLRPKTCIFRHLLL